MIEELIKREEENNSIRTASSTPRRIHDCITEVDFQLYQIALQSPLAVDLRLTLSIAVLSDFLTHVFEVPKRNFAAGFPLLMTLEDRMYRDGWCPSMINKLRGKVDSCLLYFVSNTGPPSPGESHSKCLGRQCLASQMDESTYITKHVCKEGNCGEVRADKKELFKILQEGAIPLIYSNHDQNASQISLHRDDRCSQYVAISHVWSDGLGNLRDNALPQCQLARLSELVNSLYEPRSRPIPFWVDTICCPVEPEEATNMAIVQMRKTYLAADKVLVLDSYIEVTDRTAADVERILRILCCGWTRRLWTLQEGALANALYFQFPDGPYDLDAAVTRLRECVRSSEYVHVLDHMREFHDSWNRGSLESPTTVIPRLSRALRYRATSVPEDEALCLATLFGLNMEKIVKVRPCDRMKQFWSLVANPPAGLIFWTGLKLEEPGLQWAPKSFLPEHPKSPSSSSMSYLEVFGDVSPFEIFLEDTDPDFTNFYELGDGRPTNKGLVVQCPSIILNYWVAVLGPGFFIRYNKSTLFHVICSHETIPLELHPPVHEPSPRCLALLLEKPITEITDALDRSTAVIVSFQRTESGVVCARTEGVGSIGPFEIDEDAAGLVEFFDLAESTSYIHGETSSDERTTTNEGLVHVVLSDGQEADVRNNEGRMYIVCDSKHYFFEGDAVDFQEWCIV